MVNIKGLEIERDSDMVRVSPGFLLWFAQDNDRPEAEAIFISCGALRSLDIVQELETIVQKPVVCSNQAMMWNTLSCETLRQISTGAQKDELKA